MILKLSCILSTKLCLIQKLRDLSHYTKAHRVCHWKYYILHIKFMFLRHYMSSYPGRSQQKKNDFYVLLNEFLRSFTYANFFQFLLSFTWWMWASFGFCFRFLSLIVSEICCSQKSFFWKNGEIFYVWMTVTNCRFTRHIWKVDNLKLKMVRIFSYFFQFFISYSFWDISRQLASRSGRAGPGRAGSLF